MRGSPAGAIGDGGTLGQLGQREVPLDRYTGASGPADRNKREVFMQDALMREAVRLALENVENGGRPFGAVVVRAGEIVSRGVNTVMQSHDPTAHAEMNAIREAVRALGRADLSDCEIYASGEPCPMCYGAIHWARIPVVYYGCSGEDAAAVGFATTTLAAELCRPVPQRAAPRMVQYGREEALAAFRAWQARPDAKRD